MELFKYKKPIDFMGKSRHFGILSITLVLISWALIFTKGFNYGIDFAGGTLIQIKYEQKAPIEKIAGRYRFNILLRSRRRTPLLKALSFADGNGVEVDMDPVDFS